MEKEGTEVGESKQVLFKASPEVVASNLHL
jgi:hypothetical protein